MPGAGCLGSDRRRARARLLVDAAVTRRAARRKQRTEIGPPVDLFEYQAKELFAEYGVPVPKDKVADTPEEAREITAAFAAEGTPEVVVKAQVKTGGRGKAGGVKLADGPAHAYEKAQRIIGMDIKGHTVHKVLIAEATDIQSEYYLS